MNTKTRFKLTVIAGSFLSVMTVLATVLKQEIVATTSLTGIMTILSAYIWSQTRRPSYNENANADNSEK